MNSNSNDLGRQMLANWKQATQENLYECDPDFKHSIHLYLSKKNPSLENELKLFAERVIHELDPLVIENNLYGNLPRIETYDGIGQRIEKIIHHPTYEIAGNIIYSSRLLERMSKPGGLSEALAFMFLSSQTGEAGHNCPLACSAGLIRVLQKTEDFPLKNFYMEKLITPSYTHNYTGAQFLTEIQGGSDVGANAVEAYQDETGRWRIHGEKWFCSNADAELILITARFDKKLSGTKGLGLFLISSTLEDGKRNHYSLRRLKDKIGTRSMASAEIDFHEAYAQPVGLPSQGFKLVMENVLHVSRLFNTFCVLGMARRAYSIALAYAKNREAFGSYILNYPLVQENLATIKAENSALLASIFATTQIQDAFDLQENKHEEMKWLLRLLANLNKYLSSRWSVDHIHHALDVLAGNGAIESFSIIPRLLRDSIVCENWEGTHNTLRMQILKDILRYNIDGIFLSYIEKKLSSIEPVTQYHSIIQSGLLKLKNQLLKLKAASHEIQTLQIKDIIDLMAILFSSIQLLQEAIDQMKDNQYSKVNCLKFFLRSHLDPSEKKYNADYLDLIQSITETSQTS